jgi:hypothetical protein
MALHRSPLANACRALALVAIAAPTISWAQQAPVAVLVPGAGGPVPSDFLMRNADQIRAAGIEGRRGDGTR